MGHTNELVIHAWNKDEGPIEIATNMIDDRSRKKQKQKQKR